MSVNKIKVAYNLKLANIGIRKAAALKGIWSGRVIFLAPETDELCSSEVIAKIFNKNYTAGIIITQFECKAASCISWREINNIKGCNLFVE